MSFCNVLCESDASSLVVLSSGVVGLEEANSDDAEWNVASDAVEADGGCGYIAVIVCNWVGDPGREGEGDMVWVVCMESR